MATDQEILAEPRLTDEQEVMLYNLTLRQDELGRQQTNMLLEKIEGDTIYKDMLERELLTYEVFDHGVEGTPKICSLYVTLKGVRYCILHADEIEPKRRWDAAGNRRW